MIKKLENLKNYNIICTNTDEVKECLDILKKLGFKIYDEINDIIDYKNIFISYFPCAKMFMSTDLLLEEYKNINFYQFKKQTKKFLKEKEKQLPDFEVASDGRIIKINNYRSDKTIYIEGEEDFIIRLLDHNYLRCRVIELGKAFKTLDAKNKAEEKRRIYTQLKNLAERLNNGEKNDWNNKKQKKYFIYYDYNKKKLKEGYNNMCRNQGTIYCIDINFLEIAEKEIGEENLLKLFED